MAFAYYLGTTRSSRMKDETLSKVVKWKLIDRSGFW
jgi:hypothetical protein